MKKEKRFEIAEAESHGLSPSTHIIVDKKTGVNYLYVASGYGGGVTPLLNRDGTPVVTTVAHEE